MATWLVVHVLLLPNTALPVGTMSLEERHMAHGAPGASAAAHADTACVSGTVLMK